MLNRLDATFARLRRRKEKALVAYLTAGFPSMAAMPKLVQAVVRGGADVLELGVPFSDPLADGPTIQVASAAALRNGVTTAQVLRLVAQLRRSGVTLPIALLTYFNPVLHYGVERFCVDAVRAGVDGVVIPDLPVEEAQEIVPAARAAGLATIFLAAPTSTTPRLRKIARVSRGFIYFVSLTGVTGARTALPKEVSGHLRRLRKVSRLPICVGFGISRADQVKQLGRDADGAIVGSALINLIGRDGNPAGVAERFIRQLKNACV